MNTRLIFTAAALPADQARAMLTLVCANKSTAFHRTRRRLQKRFKAAISQLLNFAKHEVLRKLRRYLHAHRPLMGQETQPFLTNPGVVRINFNLDELEADLNAILDEEARLMLGTATSSTLASVGFRDPWALPAQDTLDFITRRQNLLSGVPQEIFDRIRDELSQGLNAGENLRDLSARITETFDLIDSERADLIAETESAAAYSYASDRAARAAGIGYKQWLHGASKVPRPDHLGINGLIVPIDEPYPVGSPPLMYPHDENGSPEDVINCSCISIPVSGPEDSQLEGEA